MSTYKLYINGREVDFATSQATILFQRQRTDYTNPTIVKNSFTKTITLPGTKNNNRIFCDIWKLDRVQSTNSFNASKRTPFYLIKDGDLVEKGYAKLNTISWKNDVMFSYEITLYGELGNILYGLSYRTDPITEESIPLTLGDLDFGFDGFSITKDVILDSWRRLKEGTGSAVYDTINFAVCYDGIPQANNFDAKSVWVSTGTNDGNRPCRVSWMDQDWAYGVFPKSYTDEDNITYTSISTRLSRMDPDEYYGLFELKNEITPLEARDLRSYLLRPVIRLSKVFDAIGTYIEENMGYTLDLTDPFFFTSEFTDTWITLSMLYELDPDVVTGTYFSKEKLLSNTSTPASYLISYCKTYGIYLDVNYKMKTFKLTRLPRFFSGDTKMLKINTSKSIKVTPLSFDKSAYIFNYGAGESEFQKQYSDTYGVEYGIKRVNTGYMFDSSSSPYIDNNVFKQGLDAIEQSIYFRYPYAVFGDNLVAYPGALTDLAHLPTYKLFHKNGSEYESVEGEMKVNNGYAFGRSRAYLYGTGYQFINPDWSGLKVSAWQDNVPRLQFHSEDNKGADGKDVLVTFNGFKASQYGTQAVGNKTYFRRHSLSPGYEYVRYLVSDDDQVTPMVIGKNAYYDNPAPKESGYGGTPSNLSVVTELPMFNRCKYILDYDQNKMPVCIYKSFETYNYVDVQYASHTVTSNEYFTTIVTQTSHNVMSYTYIDISGYMAQGHQYFIGACVSASTHLTGNLYPNVINSRMINHTTLNSDTTAQQVIGSIIQINTNDNNKLVPLTSNPSSSSSRSWNTYYIYVYDLTAMGLENYFSTAEQAISFFGLTTTSFGYTFNITDTLDFAISRELYVPSCTFNPGIGIYNRYWSRYISDVYSINTKVMECYCYLDNIDNVFREFYYYDNSIWILSKIVDWNGETKMCKATFIKVNDKDDYIN